MHWFSTNSAINAEPQVCSVQKIQGTFCFSVCVQEYTCIYVHVWDFISLVYILYLCILYIRMILLYVQVFVSSSDTSIWSSWSWLDFSFVRFNSFHFPDCLTFSMPHIRYALHLKSHMARYICTFSLVDSLSSLPWALQPAPHWYSTSFSHKGSSLELYFVLMPSKYQRILYVWHLLWPFIFGCHGTVLHLKVNLLTVFKVSALKKKIKNHVWSYCWVVVNDVNLWIKRWLF